VAALLSKTRTGESDQQHDRHGGKSAGRERGGALTPPWCRVNSRLHRVLRSDGHLLSLDRNENSLSLDIRKLVVAIDSSPKLLEPYLRR